MKEKISRSFYNSLGEEVYSYDTENLHLLDGLVYRKSAVFYKGFSNCVPTFNRKSSYGHMFRILPYLQKGSNVLMCPTKSGVVPMTKELMMDCIDIKDRAYYEFVGDCADNLIMIKHKKKFFINPCYFINGSIINPELFLIFMDSKDFIESLTYPLVEGFQNITGKDYKTHLKLKFPSAYKRMYKHEIR